MPVRAPSWAASKGGFFRRADSNFSLQVTVQRTYVELWKQVHVINCLARPQLKASIQSFRPHPILPRLLGNPKDALHKALYLGILWDVTGHQLEGSKWREHVFSCSIDPAKPLFPYKPSFYLIPGSADSLMLAFILSHLPSPPPRSPFFALSFLYFLDMCISRLILPCVCTRVHTHTDTHTPTNHPLTF